MILMMITSTSPWPLFHNCKPYLGLFASFYVYSNIDYVLQSCKYLVSRSIALIANSQDALQAATSQPRFRYGKQSNCDPVLAKLQTAVHVFSAPDSQALVLSTDSPIT